MVLDRTFHKTYYILSLGNCPEKKKHKLMKTRYISDGYSTLKSVDLYLI